MLESVLPRIPAHAHLDGDKLKIQRIYPAVDHLHGHDFLELVYVMQGSSLHQLGTETQPVRAGDFFIVDFGSYHRYLETKDFQIVNCLFAPEYVDRMLVHCPSLSDLIQHRRLDARILQADPANRIYHDDSGHIRALFEAMEQEYAAKPVGYAEMIRCYLIEVLVQTVRLASQMEAVHHRHPAAAAMAEYLYEHYAEPLSLEELSIRLGYTPQYLSTLFHRETGMSLSAYLQRVRIDRSCRLLAETMEPIATIAQQVGYGDQKHFVSIFRRYTGLSPRAYRSRLRENGSRNL